MEFFKRNWLLLAFLVCAVPNWAQAQLAKRDSMLIEVEQMPSDSDKVRAYLNLYKLFIFSDSEKALEIAHKARAIADSLGYQMGMGDSYRMEGVYYIINGATDLALEHYQKAYEIYSSLGDEHAKLMVMNNFGTVFMDLENFDSALTYFRLAEGKVPNNFSDSMLVGTMRHNEAVCLDMLGQSKESYEVLKANSTFFANTNAVYELSITHRSLGEVAIKMGNYEEALQELKLARQYKETLGDQRAISNILVQMARAHQKLGNRDSALYLGEKGVQMAKELGSMSDLSANYMNMAEIYHGLGQSDTAYALLLRHQALEDSLKQAETISKVMNLQSVYGLKNKNMEIEKLQQDIALDNARIESNRMLIIALAAGLVLIFLALVAMFLYLRARSRLHLEVAGKNLALSKANDALAASIREREALLHMMIHDLKVPLNNSEAMVTMLKSLDGMPEMSRVVLEKMSDSNRRGIELISDLLTLYELEAKTEIQKNAVDCRELVLSVAMAMEGQASQKSIRLRVEEGKDAICQTNSSMLRRILENLCSNALKFSPKDTEVVLGLEVVANGVRIYVKDQGPGIKPEEQKLLFNKFTKLSNRPTAGEHSNGLGLAIVKALAERLGAEVGFVSQKGEGAKFWVELPA